MSEENKIVELKEEDLEKVSGGLTSNPDGTYSFRTGEQYVAYLGCPTLYEVLYDQLNLSLEAEVYMFVYWVDDDGNLICQMGTTCIPVNKLVNQNYIKI